jgi:ketosteroid isomerase-like protein
MSDPIAPPVARRPEDAVELVAQVFSDGDIEAVLAQYEDAAQLLPGAWPPDADYDDLPGTVHRLMALRLPLTVQIRAVLQAPGLALVVCDRRIAGTGPDCEPVQLSGHGATAVRPQPDGTWRIAADAWCLENEIPLDPPEIPPGTEADAGASEGPRRAASTTQS